jgi:hypothetical protein
MPFIYRFTLLFFGLLGCLNGADAQCSTTPCTTPVPSVDATQACILPSPTSLDCYYGATTDDLPISLPPSWCVVINNNHWFAFIADSTAATFNITCYGCAAGNGVQAAVLSTADCIDFTFNSPCLMEISTQTSQVLVASPLVPGNTYYLCMDGVGGALCEYAINASNPTVTGTASGICVPSKPTGTYSTSGVSSWSIQPPSAGIIIGNPIAKTITVSWTEPGNAEVCARFTGCPNAPEYCFPVLIGGDVSEVQEVEVCQGKSVECAGKVFTTPGTFPVKLKTYLNCDSLINCVVHVIPKVYTTEMHYFCQNQSVVCAGVEFDNGGIFPVTLEGENGCDSVVTCKISMIPTLYTTETHYFCQNETTTCAGVEFGTSGTFPVTLTRVNGCDSVVQCKIVEIPTIVTPFKLVTLCGPASYTLCSDTYTNSGLYTEICTSSKGCDSIVNVDLAILEPKAVIAPPGILDCTVNTAITLDGSGASKNTTPGGQTFYAWTGPGIVGAKDSAQIKVNQAGTYCLIVTHRRAGVACSDTACVQVTAVSAIPPLPVLMGDVTPCPDSLSIYTATAVGSPAPSSFTWTTPGAYTVLSMQAIQIAWTGNLSGGPICVVANNSCGASPPACINVAVQDTLQIPVLSGPATVCAGGGTYLYTLDGKQAGTTYTWSVPAGATLTGSGDTVRVNFLNSSSGAVCVEAQTACEKGAVVCKNVTVQPIPSVQLTGGGVVCAGDSIQLTFTLSGNGPFTVNWFNGSTLDTLNAISDGYTLSLAPGGNTQYHLIGVADHTSPNGCTNLAHDSVSVIVHPKFAQSKSVQLCEGQSIVAGGSVQTQSGVYVDSLQTIFGCDSILTTVLTVYKIDSLTIQFTTCDPALAEIHTDTYLQTNGCDSIVTTRIQLLPTDTTLQFSTSCDLAKVGVFTKKLSNVYGCDSTVISTVSFSLSDTTLIFTGNCDSAATGTFFKNLFTTEGCDSVVITKVSLLPHDTTLLFNISCNPGEIGVFKNILTNQYGCDSTVITTVTFSHKDTTFLSTTTCDSTAVGIFPKTLKTSGGCDSVVITNVSLLPSNTTMLSGASCNPAEAGVFTQHLTNKFGCDSTVITTIAFFHLDTTFLSATTCDPAAVGVFPKTIKTAEGCDSVVITNISLLPSNLTQLTDFSCNPTEVGVFTQKLTNIYGCDSTVIRKVQLLPSSTTLLQYSTCDPLQVGTVVTVRSNYLGCDSTITAITSLLPASGCGVTASLTGSTIPCGQTKGFLTLTPTLGEAPFDFGIQLNGVTLKNGTLNEVNIPVVIDSLPPGNYTVILSSTNGFSTTAQSSIVQWFTPSLSVETITDFNQYAISCQGAMDGQVRAMATGGKAPYLFSWSDGSSSDQAKGLGAGTYQVTVTDANQCTQTASVTLTEPTALSFNFSVSDLTCFGTNNGRIYVDAQGGVPPGQTHQKSL